MSAFSEDQISLLKALRATMPDSRQERQKTEASVSRVRKSVSGSGDRQISKNKPRPAVKKAERYGAPLRDTANLLPLGALAMRLDFSIALLVEEALDLEIPVGREPSAYRLSRTETEKLEDFVSHYRGLQKQPWKASDYVPRPDGTIRLSEFDLIEVAYRTRLVKEGYLPKRTDIAARPGFSWSHVLKHVEYRENRRPVRVDQPLEGPAQSPSKPTSVKPERIRITGKSAVQGIALIPPKSSLVADMRSKLTQRIVAKQQDPEREVPADPIRDFKIPRTTQTTSGRGSAVISELSAILSSFSPSDHAVLFDKIRRVLEFDRQIAGELSKAQSDFATTQKTLLGVMSEVCSGRFGLFAYHGVGNAIAELTRRNPSQATLGSLTGQVKKLLPMDTGLLTDMGRSRFIFWTIRASITIAIVEFSDFRNWLDGIHSGRYQALEGDVVILRRGAELDEVARNAGAFLAEAARMLRSGYKIRHVSERSAASSGKMYLAGRTALPPKVLRYVPHSSWLVPITIEGKNVSAGLGENFFTNHGAKAAHAVRATYRRPPGSHRNAEKSVYVQAHVRGGYDVGEISLMPAVTIMRLS